VFYYDMPTIQGGFEFEFPLATFVIPVGPVPVPVTISWGGAMSFAADFNFGYDTYGVQKSMDTGDYRNILDGFYISDVSLPDFRNGAFVPGTGGIDKDELSLDFDLGLYAEVDAMVTLPGGTGTLEELLEVLTLKRLGLFLKPVVIVNQRGFYDPLIRLLNDCVSESFMHPRHRERWTVVDRVEQVIPAIRSSPTWTSEARDFAVQRSV
jgi:hypothetical protein